VEARPGTLVSAVVLAVLGAIGSLVTLPLMPDEAPEAIIPISIALAIVSLLGAWFLWQGLRWAAILLFVVTAFNGLSSAPGVLEADETYNKVLAGVGVLLAVVVCALLVRRSTRAALR
jgi:hypothetical protein